MKVRFYGVRASIATPGHTTLKYGGNTACTYVELNDGSQFIFDAGTGLRRLGQDLLNDKRPIHLLVSHNHWDHIQGFPFFDPIFDSERHIHIASRPVEGLAHLPVLNTVGGPFHPVEFESLGATFHQYVLPETSTTLSLGGATIRTLPLNHPNGGNAYRLDADGLSVAYVTDNELFPPDEPETGYDQWLQFLNGVDLLIHDSQYSEKDMPERHGWGHSLISQVLTLASDCEARSVAIYHHDPDRTDSQLDEIHRNSKAMFKQQGKKPQIFCAAEGQTILLTSTSISSH